MGSQRRERSQPRNSSGSSWLVRTTPLLNFTLASLRSAACFPQEHRFRLVLSHASYCRQVTVDSCSHFVLIQLAEGSH